MKTYKKMIVPVLLFVAVSCKGDGQETNSFSTQLKARWKMHDASNVVNFVIAQYQSDTNDPKRVFARGVVAGCGQSWYRGASNFVMRAHDLIVTSTNYPSSTKKEMAWKMKQVAMGYGCVANMVKESFDSGPVVNKKDLAALFLAWPSDIQYCEIIKELDCNNKGDPKNK